MKINFFPIDINYKIEDNKVVTYIVGKTTDSKKICFVDNEYLPYFYVLGDKISTLSNEIKNIRIQEKNNLYFVQKTEIVEKEFNGKNTKALKVFVNRPKALRKISEQLEPSFKSYEHDILYERKYLIDKKIIPFTLHEAEGEEIRARVRTELVFNLENIKNISGETLKPKIMAIDIETLYKREIENNPVIMISFYTNDYKKTITYANIERENIQKVRSEAELLAKFKDEIQGYNPDIIVGYNSDYSISHINRRANRYEIKMDMALDYSELRTSKRGRVKLFGFVHLDLQQFIKNILFESLEAEDYDLDYISYELLGEDIEYNAEELANVLKDKQLLKNYIRDIESDAKLIFTLTLNVLPNIFEILKLVHISMFDICRMRLPILAETLIISYTREFNQICLNKPGKKELEIRKTLEYNEDLIVKPNPGIYKDIAAIYFSNQYPQIILSHNISPETLNLQMSEKEKVPGKDYYFSKEKKGVIPKIIEDLTSRKTRIEEVMDKADKSLKARFSTMDILSKSFFYYFFFSGARWYSLECAESINSYLNYYLGILNREASKDKVDLIYRDNDVLFLNTDKDKAKIFLDNFNKSFTKNIDFNFDEYFKSGIFVSLKETEEGAIKKYALLDYDDKLSIKGFEAIRKNTPLIVKEIQKNVLMDILQDKDKNEILLEVKRKIKNISDNEIPKEKVILQTQLQKSLDKYEHITPYVAAAKLMKEKGFNVKPGTIIKYIIVKGSDKISKRVKLPEDTTQYEYDPEYYINNQLISALEPIFRILDISKEELLEEKDQSKLDKYI
jgi:DNA polymerase, archaea type